MSLAECLLTCFLVSACVAPLLGLLCDNAQVVSFNQDRAVAQILAGQVLERFRFEGYDWLQAAFVAPSIGARTIADDALLTEMAGEHETRFSRSALVEEKVPGLLATFTCTVTWENNQKRPCQYRTSMMVRNGEFHHGKP